MTDWKEVVKSSVTIIQSFIKRGITPTLRTVYYALVSKEVIPNTMSAYKRLSTVLVEARKEGKIDWSWIADDTRSTLSARSVYDICEGVYSLNYPVLVDPEKFAQGHFDFFAKTADRYFLPKWKDQEYYVEVWLEKFALARTFNHWLEDVQITLVPSRGYSSWTFLKDAAARIENAIAQVGEGEDAKTPIVLYFGDFDPSGADIERFLGKALDYFGIETEVQRIAVTQEQIKQYNLPSTPEDLNEIAKLRRDPRFKSWEHGLFRVEVDALLAFVPEEFERIIKSSVLGYFDEEVYGQVQEEEGKARETIREFMADLFKQKGEKT